MINDPSSSILLLSLFLGSYVSETERRHADPSQVQRHILAGLASVVGGLSAPYEKASHVHERPVVNWLCATGCHPFGPFSNTSQVSQLLQDAALVRLVIQIFFILRELNYEIEWRAASISSNLLCYMDSSKRIKYPYCGIGLWYGIYIQLFS